MSKNKNTLQDTPDIKKKSLDPSVVILPQQQIQPEQSGESQPPTPPKPSKEEND